MRTLAMVVVKFLAHFLALGAVLGWFGGIDPALVALAAAWTTVILYVVSDLFVMRLFGEGPGLTADLLLSAVAVFVVMRAGGFVLSLAMLSYAVLALLFVEILGHAAERQGLFVRR